MDISPTTDGAAAHVQPKERARPATATTTPKITLKKRDKTRNDRPKSAQPQQQQAAEPASTNGATPTSDGAASDNAVAMPAVAKSSPSGGGRQGSNFEQCDLCQLDCPQEHLEEHIAKQHTHLTQRIESLAVAIHELSANPVALSPAAAEAFGAFIRNDVAPSDKGEAVFQHALAAHDQVSRLLQRRFPKCKVFMFGSTVSMGSWDGAGDIDLTLVDPAGWDSGKWPGTPDTEGQLVGRFANICRDAGFAYGDLEPLRRVRVPVLKHNRPFKLDLSEHTGTYVVKFKFVQSPTRSAAEVLEKYFEGLSATATRWQDSSRLLVSFPTGLAAFDQYMANHRTIPPHTVYWDSFTSAPEMFGIDFDLTSRAHGIRNSWLLRAYMSQSSLVRAGSVFLKHWSKASAVNYSMKGYLTSYAVNMLWVYYLLRRGLVTFVDPVADVEGSPQRSPVAGTYIPLLEPAQKDSPAFMREMAEAVYGFFCFYAYEFNWEEEVVSIRRAGLTTKADLGWQRENEIRSGPFRDRVWYRLCIEDPFEANLNLGRHASVVKALKIRSQFFRAALAAAGGDFGAILKDNTTNAATERLQRLFPRVMLARGNAATIDEVLADIIAIDPDVLAAVEAEGTVARLPGMCGCMLEEGTTVSPSSATALVTAAFADAVPELDKAVDAAGIFGLPTTPLHSVNNAHPLYFSSPTSHRLFASGKAMRRYDEHHSAILGLLADKDGVCHKLKGDDIRRTIREKIPKVDDAIVAHILNDSRFVSFDGRDSTYGVTKKLAAAAAEKAKPAPETMDHSSRSVGNCDECNKRTTVYGSSHGGRAKYCEPCWTAYLKK